MPSVPSPVGTQLINHILFGLFYSEQLLNTVIRLRFSLPEYHLIFLCHTLKLLNYLFKKILFGVLLRLDITCLFSVLIILYC